MPSSVQVGIAAEDARAGARTPPRSGRDRGPLEVDRRRVALHGSSQRPHRARSQRTAVAALRPALAKRREPVRVAEDRLGAALRVGHHAEHVAARVADARRWRAPRRWGSTALGVSRAVRRRRSGRPPGRAASSAVELLAARPRSCPRRGRSACAAPGPSRSSRVNGRSSRSTRRWTSRQRKRRLAVAPHGAGQEARLEQDLEAVADAEHQPARLGVPLDRRHHRRERRHRAGAQVVAVGEAARQDHEVAPLEGRRPGARGRSSSCSSTCLRTW